MQPAAPTADTELVGIARFTFHDGMAEEFERLSADCLQIVKAKDPGTLQYDTFISADRTRAVVIERYRDSASLIAHHANIGETMMAAVIATGTVEGELLGSPNPELAAMLAQSTVTVLALHQSLGAP